jgi:hypothetical protein
VCTRACHQSPHWDKWSKFTLPHPVFFKVHFNIILPSVFHFHINWFESHCSNTSLKLVWQSSSCSSTPLQKGLYYFGNGMALESLKLCPVLLDSSCHILLCICAWKLQMAIELYAALLWCVIVTFRMLSYVFPICRMVSLSHYAIVYWNAIAEVFRCWLVTA